MMELVGQVVETIQQVPLMYNGTSWAVSPANMSTGRLMYHNNAGTDSSGLVFGGEGPFTQTEEFIAAGALETQTITTT